MVLCAAYGCNSRSGVDKVSFFKFPEEPKRRRLWIDRLNRGDSVSQKFAPSCHHKLCSKHFEDDQFVVSPSFAEKIGFGAKFLLRLKEDSVPSIFEWPRQKRPAPAERRSAANIMDKKLKFEVCIQAAFS